MFLEFLRSLGWSVNVFKHPGWTGNYNTSWKIIQQSQIEQLSAEYTGGGQYNGDLHVLYWSDVCSELAFVVPAPKLYQTIPVSTASNVDSSGSSLTAASSNSSLSLSESAATISIGSMGDGHDPMPPSRNKRGMKQYGSNIFSCSDHKILIVWLSSYEDYQHIPLADMLLETTNGSEPLNQPNMKTLLKETVVIFIHPLHSGLFRIHLQGQVGRMSLATPLIDGMVVSRRTLGSLVRQTCLNVAKRKRLDSDSYHPPHVKRKLKIQELSQKYGQHLDPPDFYINLFTTIV